MSERSKKLAESVLARFRSHVAEDAQELEELSKTTLKSYIHKAVNPTSSKSISNLAGKAGFEMGQSDPDDYKAGEKDDKKAFSRSKGVMTAASKLAKEEAEELEELSKGTLASYIKKAAGSAADKGMEHGMKKAEADEMDRVMNRHMSFSDKDKVRGIMKTTTKDVEKPREKAGRRIQGIGRAVNRLAKEDIDEAADRQSARERAAADMASMIMKKTSKKSEADGKWSRQSYQLPDGRWASKDVKVKSEAVEECMTDTSLSDVKPSAKGEVYSKSSEKTTATSKPTGTKTGVTSSKTGEAYNTTGITKRMPAVENAVLDVMAKSLERRRIYQESTNIAIVSPEQRNDWMNVERGAMDVVSYFNKYRVSE